MFIKAVVVTARRPPWGVRPLFRSALHNPSELRGENSTRDTSKRRSTGALANCELFLCSNTRAVRAVRRSAAGPIGSARCGFYSEQVPKSFLRVLVWQVRIAEASIVEWMPCRGNRVGRRNVRKHVSLIKNLSRIQPVSYKEQVEFLDWLKERGQRDAYLSTTVGISTHGSAEIVPVALFATRPIQAGERVLRVSRDLTSYRRRSRNFCRKMLVSGLVLLSSYLPSSIRARNQLPTSFRVYSQYGTRIMAAEATKLDGRLARRPLKDKNREAQAMSLLLARLESMMQQRHSALLTLRLVETCRGSNSGSKSPVTMHVHMAGAVVSGEMRVLRSAIAWLRNHCSPSTVLT
ncbi:hypothetical protein Mp_3g12700 [Marchantia polymorpha subsp. ruderalis]|uniref:Uncharacterized protein n=2 Tax=Marchantia polymorpha TaxID=3197 RepID=A0AAF6B057_MARPO|nr:hypothetical protein Mp_3g12700 [Marchantia polymorpha subsp. ruderalis]